MAYLLDTGVLLRLVDRNDLLHAPVASAVKALTNDRQPLFTTNQNIAEFCNVATRPISQNGFGLPTATVIQLLEAIIEPVCAIVLENLSLYPELKRLVRKYSVGGKQIHDAPSRRDDAGLENRQHSHAQRARFSPLRTRRNSSGLAAGSDHVAPQRPAKGGGRLAGSTRS